MCVSKLRSQVTTHHQDLVFSLTSKPECLGAPWWFIAYLRRVGRELRKVTAITEASPQGKVASAMVPDNSHRNSFKMGGLTPRHRMHETRCGSFLAKAPQGGRSPESWKHRQAAANTEYQSPSFLITSCSSAWSTSAPPRPLCTLNSLLFSAHNKPRPTEGADLRQRALKLDWDFNPTSFCEHDKNFQILTAHTHGRRL